MLLPPPLLPLDPPRDQPPLADLHLQVNHLHLHLAKASTSLPLFLCPKPLRRPRGSIQRARLRLPLRVVSLLFDVPLRLAPLSVRQSGTSSLPGKIVHPALANLLVRKAPSRRSRAASASDASRAFPIVIVAKPSLPPMNPRLVAPFATTRMETRRASVTARAALIVQAVLRFLSIPPISAQTCVRTRRYGYNPSDTYLWTDTFSQPIRIGLLWYLNVHAEPPYRWVRTRAVLYSNMLVLSWIAPGGGRGVVTLDLLNCTEVRSVPSPSHRDARDDIGSIAALMHDAQGKTHALTNLLCPFQLLYSDGVERLGAESAQERVRSVTALW